uniref:Uncharacterized protein n=1 Tax=Ciona savignyi TaxID=51511 RepID=H2ZHL4_CIOSA
MDELLEHIHDNEKDKTMFDALPSPRDENNDEDGKEKVTRRRGVVDDFTTARSGKAALPAPKKQISDVFGMVAAEGGSNKKLGEMSVKLQQMQMTQRSQEHTMRGLVDDLQEIKLMLQSMASGNFSGVGARVAENPLKTVPSAQSKKKDLLHQIVSAVSGKSKETPGQAVVTDAFTLPGTASSPHIRAPEPTSGGVRTTTIQIDPTQGKPLGPGTKDETNV